jgi:hypothetical protein
VRVENCRVDFSKAGPFGSNFPGDLGINLSIVDGGSLDDVVIQDVDIKGVRTPITIRLGDRATLYNDTVPRPGVGTFRNILLKNITIVAREGISSTVSGINGHPLQNIRMENIDITVAGGELALPPGFVVPDNNGAKPDNDVLGEDIPAYGIFFRNVDSLILNNVCVKALQPDGREKFIFENVTNLSGPTCGVVTAVEDEEVAFSVVFPNPATDVISIQSPFSDYTCKLLNASGQILYEQSFQQASVQLPVSDFPSGIYFIQLSSREGETVSSKWMKW